MVHRHSHVRLFHTSNSCRMRARNCSALPRSSMPLRIIDINVNREVAFVVFHNPRALRNEDCLARMHSAETPLQSYAEGFENERHNGPRSIYRYSYMGTRLSGQNCNFFMFFFVPQFP